ncbi:hypothetical protein [Ralstonia pickettii]|uniref:Uncharacterized protein n=1 Tax=Ralstonia pickettii TaxID=329 RepID=A0AAW4Q8Y9_RALPI|nr:hypothetical protein [Ralstonia pickettii]MBA9846550.1 hypothetical protein [Ralstonia pickettii]MBA9851955.1 hypothetical protein [Ralstonia pickettii]MBA9919688.1 hypothetical protein [Ralstonia pickettii]MBA9958908.1 hypothetical protein [Ralstonia pickettii]MBA9965097.1 hypothetical protein [Ralstonia pickettii]
MLQFHALFGGHYGIGSMIVDAVIRSVVYNMVGNAMRGHGLSGLALIGIVLAVVCVCVLLIRCFGGMANAVGRSLRGGRRQY